MTKRTSAFFSFFLVRKINYSRVQVFNRSHGLVRTEHTNATSEWNKKKTTTANSLTLIQSIFFSRLHVIVESLIAVHQKLSAIDIPLISLMFFVAFFFHSPLSFYHEFFFCSSSSNTSLQSHWFRIVCGSPDVERNSGNNKEISKVNCFIANDNTNRIYNFDLLIRPIQWSTELQSSIGFGEAISSNNEAGIQLMSQNDMHFLCIHTQHCSRCYCSFEKT